MSATQIRKLIEAIEEIHEADVDRSAWRPLSRDPARELPLRDESKPWDLDNPRILKVVIKDNYIQSAITGDSNKDKYSAEMFAAVTMSPGRFSKDTLENERLHANRKGYDFEIVDEE